MNDQQHLPLKKGDVVKKLSLKTHCRGPFRTLVLYAAVGPLFVRTDRLLHSNVARPGHFWREKLDPRANFRLGPIFS